MHPLGRLTSRGARTLVAKGKRVRHASSVGIVEGNNPEEELRRPDAAAGKRLEDAKNELISAEMAVKDAIAREEKAHEAVEEAESLLMEVHRPKRPRKEDHSLSSDVLHEDLCFVEELPSFLNQDAPNVEWVQVGRLTEPGTIPQQKWVPGPSRERVFDEIVQDSLGVATSSGDPAENCKLLTGIRGAGKSFAAHHALLEASRRDPPPDESDSLDRSPSSNNPVIRAYVKTPPPAPSSVGGRAVQPSLHSLPPAERKDCRPPVLLTPLETIAVVLHKAGMLATWDDVTKKHRVPRWLLSMDPHELHNWLRSNRQPVSIAFDEAEQWYMQDPERTSRVVYELKNLAGVSKELNLVLVGSSSWLGPLACGEFGDAERKAIAVESEFKGAEASAPIHWKRLPSLNGISSVDEAVCMVEENVTEQSRCLVDELKSSEDNESARERVENMLEPSGGNIRVLIGMAENERSIGLVDRVMALPKMSEDSKLLRAIFFAVNASSPRNLGAAVSFDNVWKQIIPLGGLPSPKEKRRLRIRARQLAHSEGILEVGADTVRFCNVMMAHTIGCVLQNGRY